MPTVDSPAVRRWLETWDPDKHPRGWHGHFGVAGVAKVAVSVGRTRTGSSKSDLRTHAELGKGVWYNQGQLTTGMFAGKRRRRQGKHVGSMVRWKPGIASDEHGKYVDVTVKERFSRGRYGPLERLPNGFTHRTIAEPAGYKQVSYKRAAPGSTLAALKAQKARKAKRSVHEALFGYSPALARFFEAETSVAGVKGAAKLHEYWTAGKGLAKWADSPEPWTTLRDHLLKFLPKDEANRTATVWFEEIFHFGPGSDLNRVTHGKPPRGKVVGPG